MAVITHATPSDLTFSATGAIAWDADHTIDPVALRALLGVIDGVPGLQGRDGESGEDGAIGPPGQQGTAGAAGSNGSDGVSGYTIRGQDGEDGQDGFTQAPINFTGQSNQSLGGDGVFYGVDVRSYSPGSFTIPTNNYAVMSNMLVLTGSQQATLLGTSQLRIT